jgi:transposase
LPVEETVLVSDEVAADPDAYREIDRIVTNRFDFQPSRIFIQRIVRVVHVAKDQPDATPIKPAAPPSLGLSATPRFVAYITASKYCHHRPHYRSEDILWHRHGVHIPRNTLCHWDKVVADTLEPLYKLIHQGLLETGNLQADETPIKYLDPGKGKTSTGYFWVIHAPRNGIKGDILYQWHPSRKAACLDELLKDYQGSSKPTPTPATPRGRVTRPASPLSSCWAHARREFHEAFKIGQRLAAGPHRRHPETLPDRNRACESRRHAPERSRRAPATIRAGA